MVTSCEFSAVPRISFIDLYSPFLVAKQKLTNVWSCKVLCGVSGVLCGPVQSFAVLRSLCSSDEELSDLAVLCGPVRYSWRSFAVFFEVHCGNLRCLVLPQGLGLCPGPHWGSLQRSPIPPSWWGGSWLPLPKNTTPASAKLLCDG